MMAFWRFDFGSKLDLHPCAESETANDLALLMFVWMSPEGACAYVGKMQ